jgi:transcriptional regulator GlxA family with amidase domain
MEPKQRSVAILIFEGVELLDFVGPFEVFSSARASSANQERLMTVFAVAEQPEPVACRNGLVVQPAYTLVDCPPTDILVLPGGYGTRSAINRPELIDWIVQCSRTAELTTSVCTGSFLLAKAGLLTGRPATTHWASIQRMRQDFPALEIREHVRWVDAGNIVTGAGVSAGIDMSLHVLARLYGPEIATTTARDIEYDYWKP